MNDDFKTYLYLWIGTSLLAPFCCEKNEQRQHNFALFDEFIKLMLVELSQYWKTVISSNFRAGDHQVAELSQVKLKY